MNENRSNIEQLIAELVHPDYDRATLAREALIRMGHSAIKDLSDALRQASERQTWLIINILAQIGHRDAIPAVLDCLNSDNRAIQAICAQFIAAVGDQREVPALLEVLNRAPESSASIWIIHALGRIGDRSAVHPLMRIVEETNSPMKRYTAIEALGVLGDHRCVDLITRYTDDDNHHVRSRAQYAVELLTQSNARMA